MNRLPLRRKPVQLVKKPRRVRGAAAKKMKSVFGRDMCVAENTSRSTNVRGVRLRRAPRALRQAETPLSEKAAAFFDSRKPPPACAGGGLRISVFSRLALVQRPRFGKTSCKVGRLLV